MTMLPSFCANKRTRYLFCLNENKYSVQTIVKRISFFIFKITTKKKERGKAPAKRTKRVDRRAFRRQAPLGRQGRDYAGECGWSRRTSNGSARLEGIKGRRRKVDPWHAHREGGKGVYARRGET